MRLSLLVDRLQHAGIERDVGLGAFAALEDQRDNRQSRAVRKGRFHVWIIAQCLQQARPWRRYGLRPFLAASMACCKASSRVRPIAV